MKKGLDPKKICGVTTLDCVRANKFVHEITEVPINDINIPVVCGHAGATILPLFSQDPAGMKVPADKLADLDKRVQDAGTEVVNAKGGKGSAGDENVVECTYVMSDVVPECPYFSSQVQFGAAGVTKVLPVGTLSEHETTRFAEAVAQLKEEIQAGLDYAKDQELSF